MTYETRFVNITLISKYQGCTYGDHVLGGLELPESDIDGDTTLTLGLELVKNPGWKFL